jgi:hypothetical protein
VARPKALHQDQRIYCRCCTVFAQTEEVFVLAEVENLCFGNEKGILLPKAENLKVIVSLIVRDALINIPEFQELDYLIEIWLCILTVIALDLYAILLCGKQFGIFSNAIHLDDKKGFRSIAKF